MKNYTLALTGLALAAVLAACSPNSSAPSVGPTSIVAPGGGAPEVVPTTNQNVPTQPAPFVSCSTRPKTLTVNHRQQDDAGTLRQWVDLEWSPKGPANERVRLHVQVQNDNEWVDLIDFPTYYEFEGATGAYFRLPESVTQGNRFRFRVHSITCNGEWSAWGPSSEVTFTGTNAGAGSKKYKHSKP